MLDYKKITDLLSLPLFKNFKRIYYEMTEIDVVLEKINDPCEQNFEFFYTASMSLEGLLFLEGHEYSLDAGLLISWSKEGYMLMCSKIMGFECEEFSEQYDDVGMEVINITVGNSKRDFSDELELKMSLPISTIGDNHRIEIMKDIPRSKYAIRSSKKDLVRLSFYYNNPE